jgi:myo-inositol-1(or 4)-monophosphatase
MHDIYESHTLLSRIEEVARRAGALMTASPVARVEEKSAFNFVTELDMAVNAYLAEALPELVSGSVVVSEETSDRDYRFERATWIVDPVDGTTNLIYGANQSAVSICLVENGRPAAGVVYNPFADEMYSASAGGGAYLGGLPIKPRPDAFLRDSLIGFGTSPYNKKLLLADLPLLAAVFSECIDLRRSGSAALDLCYVACGRLTGFFERWLRPWDYAAGLVILSEAGAMLSTFDGSAPDIAHSASILASNGRIHDELLSLTRPYAVPGRAGRN